MKGLIIFFFFFPLFAIASDEVEAVKFNIIKAAVKFYETDTVAFKHFTGGQDSCIGINYDCLIKYCRNNGLDNVDGKVLVWSKIICNSKSDLEKFVSLISKDITQKNRAYRDTMSSFSSFKETANNEVRNIETENGKILVEVKVMRDSMDSLKERYDTRLLVLENDKYPVLFYLILIAVIVSLGVSLFAIRNNKKGGNDVDSGRSLESRVEGLTTTVNTISQSKGIAEEIINKLKSRINELDERINKLNSPRTGIVTSTVVGEEDVLKSLSNEDGKPIRKFAKAPDINNGFSFDNLADVQTGEEFFEIIIKENEADLLIANNVDAQNYALYDYKNYLSEACDFLNQPSRNCKIYTRTPGLLAKSSEGWMIQTKAKIEFKQ